MLTLTTPNPTLQAQDAAEQMQVLDLEPQCCNLPFLTKFIWFMGWGCFIFLQVVAVSAEGNICDLATGKPSLG